MTIASVQLHAKPTTKCKHYFTELIFLCFCPPLQHHRPRITPSSSFIKSLLLGYTTRLQSNPKEIKAVLFFLWFFRSQDQFLILWMWVPRKISGTARSLLRYHITSFVTAILWKISLQKEAEKKNNLSFGYLWCLLWSLLWSTHKLSSRRSQNCTDLDFNDFSWGRRSSV